MSETNKADWGPAKPEQGVFVGGGPPRFTQMRPLDFAPGGVAPRPPMQVVEPEEQAPPALTAEQQQQQERQHRDEVADLEAKNERDDRDGLAVYRKFSEKWGEDYGKKMAGVRDYIGRLPEHIREKLIAARLPDGSRLTNSPKAVEMVRRVVEIEKQMREDRAGYNRDQATQTEHGRLLGQLLRAAGIK